MATMCDSTLGTPPFLNWGVVVVVAHAKLGAKGTWPRTIDRLAVLAKPRADSPQNMFTRLGHLSLTVGSDVEQVVSPLADNVDQSEQYFSCTLPRQIVRLKAPGMVHRGGTFPRTPGILLGILVVAHRQVVSGPLLAQTSAHEALRLKPPDCVLEQHGPLGVHFSQWGVEPDECDRPVAGQKLRDLRQYFAGKVPIKVPVLERVPLRNFPDRIALMGALPDGTARTRPVLSLGIVDAERELVPRTGLRQLLDHVGFSVGPVEQGQSVGLRLEQRHSVVMLGREDKIFHA